MAARINLMRGVQGSTVEVRVQGRAGVVVLERTRVYTAPYYAPQYEEDGDRCKHCNRTLPPGGEMGDAGPARSKRMTRMIINAATGTGVPSVLQSWWQWARAALA